MIFLPNIFDIYAARLRTTVQNFITKNGEKQKYIEMLKKINLAEALCYKDDREPVNIKNLAFSLLKSHTNKLKLLNLSNNYLLNKKLFTILILQLIAQNKEITIKDKCGQILVITSCEINNLKNIISALNGYYFIVINNNLSAIVLSAEKTKKAIIKTNKDWENTANPYSLINLFLQ